MKTNFFLIALAALSLTRLSAVASTPSDETALVQLPAYVVTELRQTPAEQQIKRSMDALRSLATKPIKVKAALPLPDTNNLSTQSDAKTPAKTPGVIVAGL